MSPVSSIELERNLRERSHRNAAKKTTTTKLPKGQTRVHPVEAKKQAVAEASGKQPPKKPTAKKRSSGNGSGPAQRLTNEWPSAKGKDVSIKDRVRTAEGVVIDVVGRWTRHAKSGNVPCVTGTVVSLPAGATASAEGHGQEGGRPAERSRRRPGARRQEVTATHT